MTRVRSQGEWIYVIVGDTEIRGRIHLGNIDVEQVSPQYNQEELDKATKTIEQLFKPETVPESYSQLWVKPKCSARLIELRNALKKEVSDEADAFSKYTDEAAIFTHLGEGTSADMLKLIAGQELLHKTILEFIVDEITTRCGE